jgi:hypothetical protein
VPEDLVAQQPDLLDRIFRFAKERGKRRREQQQYHCDREGQHHRFAHRPYGRPLRDTPNCNVPGDLRRAKHSDQPAR